MLYTSDYFIEKLNNFKAVKDYKTNKNIISEIAQEYAYSFSENVVYYWSEIAMIENMLLKYGKRYGLLKEFKENAIL